MDNLRTLVSKLYPYHDENLKVFPINGLSYLYNEENPEKPIFWPKDVEYFKQFTHLLNNLGIIGNFRKEPVASQDNKKPRVLCTKLERIKPYHTQSKTSVIKDGHTGYGE